MSENENKDDSIENTEKDLEVIYVQYDINVNIKNENNILLQVSEEPHSKNTNSANSTENSIEVIDEIDSPDLVNIEDYKSRGILVNSPESDEVPGTAVLCETSLETDLTGDISVPKDTDVKFFQLVNLEQSEQNIIEDIPNEVLVYTCQPTDNNILNTYPCKGCGIVVGCIFCLKSHYESIHLNLGIIQYKCDQTSYLKNYTEICHKCNLVCESKDEMFEHRKIHFVSCDVCDMSFDSALFLSNHCKMAHEKFEVIISCDLCEQWFKQLQDLSDHYESYHEMILCIVCFKRFATNVEMKKHHNSHKIVLENTESVLPYACSKCNQAFAEISELSTHLTKGHPKRPAKPNRMVVLNVTKPKKTYKSKRGMKFHDCGGLTQEIIIVNESTGKRIKTFKKEEDD